MRSAHLSVTFVSTTYLERKLGIKGDDFEELPLIASVANKAQ